MSELKLYNKIPETQSGGQWADELCTDHIGEARPKSPLLEERPTRRSSHTSNGTDTIVGSVRRVLATNPDYRDVLISVIRKLPLQAQRTLRLRFLHHESIPTLERHNINHEIEAWPGTEFLSSATTAIEVTDYGDPAPSTTSRSCAGVYGASSLPSEWQSTLTAPCLKRSAPDDEDNNNQDGSGDGPGKKQPKGNDGPGKCWLCPYFLRDSLHVPKACHTVFTEFSYLKQHMSRKHRPTQRGGSSSSPHLLMSAEQWERIEHECKQANRKRPRTPSEASKKREDILQRIWGILFGSVGFVPESLVYENVRRHQTNIIFGAVWDARAQMAVQSGQVESEADFRPTRAEASEMFLDAFNISANVPSAGSSQGTEPPLNQTPIQYNPKPPSEGSGAWYSDFPFSDWGHLLSGPGTPYESSQFGNQVGESTDLAESLIPDTSLVDADEEETLAHVGGWEEDIDPSEPSDTLSPY